MGCMYWDLSAQLLSLNSKGSAMPVKSRLNSLLEVRGKALCSGPDRQRPKKREIGVMGPSFCPCLQPLLKLIKTLLTHHNNPERPLVAFPFQFSYKSHEEWDGTGGSTSPG